MLEAISSLAFKADDRRFAVTVGIGVAERAGEGDSLSALMKRSDDALYRAKNSGTLTGIAIACVRVPVAV